MVDLLNRARGENRDGYKMCRPVVFKDRKKYDRKKLKVNVARMGTYD